MSLKFEPVRIYGIVVAALAVAAFYLPDLPVGLLIPLTAAILGVAVGGAEVTRSKVTPVERADAQAVAAASSHDRIPSLRG